ncbi:MAG TPA: antitoxin MazE family protein [Acetobacteraceae bacterium]|nr:antitoxin MazE family protein [Acetobacteraceae bacterium]
MQRHRESLRKLGMRPIQIWVPDTCSPQFRTEAARQARVLAKSPHEREIMDWIERVNMLGEGDDPAAG